MRLTDPQRQAIREAVAEVFGPQARVRLFGSRLDDSARGGDIDLLVETPEPLVDVGMLDARLVARIQRRIGVRRIDVLNVWPGMPLQPVHRVALEQGRAL